MNRGVEIIGPAYIGDNVEIGSFSVIGPGTVCAEPLQWEAAQNHRKCDLG